MQLQKLLSGRPSRKTKEVVAKIIREVRSGASFNQACIAAGVNFVSLWRWKAADPRLDKALRTARKQAVGKGYKVGDMPMSTDAFGRPYVSPDLVCSGERHFRLIAIREGKMKWAKQDQEWWEWLIAKRAKERGISVVAMVERLQHLTKLREEFEALQVQKELRTGNVTATLPALPAPATDSISVTPLKVLPEPENDSAAVPGAGNGNSEAPETPPKPVLKLPAPATFSADRPLVGGRSPLSRPHVDPDSHSLGTL